MLQAQKAATWVGKAVIVKGGGGRWKIPAAKVRSWITFAAGPGGAPQPVIDEAAIPKALRTTKKDVARTPVSAQYLRSKSGSIFGVIAGHDGRKLDTKATAAAIVAELERRAGGETPRTVKVEIARQEPKLTTEEATKKAPLMTRLGSWQTYFPISERNYFGANIWLPAQIINGTVLKPGQRFEWWSGLGPVTTARGFGLGGFIAGDHTDPTGAMGGGMCSASTTLFNAALRAGLTMGARDNHRYYISRYPLGLDATVSSAQTMSFTNDMKTPILIRGVKIRGGGGAGYVRFEIWGTDDGRTVTIGQPQVRNVRQATTNTVKVSTLKPGEREQTEYPANGMDVTVGRVVRDRNGKVIHRDSFFSPYQLWNGRIEVGRLTRSPVSHLGGRLSAKSAPASTQRVSSGSLVTPSGATYTMPRDGRPPKSKTRTCGFASASSCASGPTRTIRSPRITPTAMLPPTMNAMPPNIFRSVTPSRPRSAPRIRSASASS